VVVFDSADPDFFIAHFDIARAADTPNEPGPTGYSPWIDFTVRLARAPVISIAAVRGRARGVGSEFALACDLRFASLEKAIFAQPEVGSGLIPGGGGIERLPLVMGRARALEVIAGSSDFDAATAERYGWISDKAPSELVTHPGRRESNQWVSSQRKFLVLLRKPISVPPAPCAFWRHQ
jgi:enoyl-CoA hydratase/carnithine racemase